MAVHFHKDFDDKVRSVPYRVEVDSTLPGPNPVFWFTLSSGHSYVTFHVESLDEMYKIARQLIREAMRLDTQPALDLMDSPGEVFAPTPEAVS